MTGKKVTPKRKFTILARILGTCLLAFTSGVLLCTVIYFLTQKYFFLDLCEQWMYASSSKVLSVESPLEEYSVLEEISFPEIMQLKAGRAVYKDMNTRGNHLLVMKMHSGKEVRYSFSGVNKLVSYAHRNGEGLVLTDEFQSYRMAIKDAPCLYPNVAWLERRTQKQWITKADPAFPYKENGYFSQEETQDGYRVILEVEGESDTGFLKLEYNLATNRLHRFLYLENKAVYSPERAKETILSATASVSATMQKEDVCLELDCMPTELDITMVLDGHPYEMMQAEWKNSNVKAKEGIYETEVLLNGEIFTHQVTVGDSVAPQYLPNEYIFFEGDRIDTNWLAENCFEDVSLPIYVSYADSNQEEIITADDAAKGVCNVMVCVTDAKGNCDELNVALTVYDNKDLPEWFRFFMDYDDKELLQRIRKGELEEVKNEYFGTYMENHWDDMYDEAVAGYKTAVRKGLDIHLEGEAWYGYPLMEVYAGINDIPTDLLDSYIENGWQINLYDGELLLGEMECAGITYYGEQKIDMTSYYVKPYSYRATFLHEFGHYVDWHYDFEIRSDEEFKEYMDAKRTDFGLTKEELEQWYSEGCIGDLYQFEYGDYRHYSVVFVEEFFADSFFFYCAYPEKLENEYPDVYNKIEDLLETNNAQNR